MKAKSRKRLLISSVAMLLVAMLALGTATFAWFTTDTTTKATGIQVETTKRSVLELSSRTSNWQTGTLDYGWYDATNDEGHTLEPASSYDGIHWYGAMAVDGSNGSAQAASAFSISALTGGNTGTAAQSYMFYNMLNIHNAGQEAINTDIEFTLVETPTVSGKNYLRVALVPASVNTQAGRATATVESDASFRSHIYSYGSDSAFPATGMTANASDATKNDLTVSSTAVSTTDATAKQTINVGTLAADNGSDGGDDEAHYMLIVWFEGQDEDCTDQYAGNVMPNITFLRVPNDLTDKGWVFNSDLLGFETDSGNSFFFSSNSNGMSQTFTLPVGDKIVRICKKNGSGVTYYPFSGGTSTWTVPDSASWTVTFTMTQSDHWNHN